MKKEYKIQYNEAKDYYRIMVRVEGSDWMPYSEKYDGEHYPQTFSSFRVAHQIIEQLKHPSSRPIDDWRDCYLV